MIIPSCLNNLGSFYNQQDKYDEAEKVYKESAAIYKIDDFKLASTLNNLAKVYQNQDKYDEAEKFYKEALVLDKDSVYLNNLGMLYSSQSKFDNAEPLLKESLSLSIEASDDADCPIVATYSQNLAMCYYALGKFIEAENC